MKRKKILFHSYDDITGEHYYSDESQIQFTPDPYKFDFLRFKPGKVYHVEDTYLWFFVKSKVRVTDNFDNIPPSTYKGDQFLNVVLFTFTDDDFDLVVTDAMVSPSGEIVDCIDQWIQYGSTSPDRYKNCDDKDLQSLIDALFSNKLSVRISSNSLHI